jgi:hypothetical protein
LIVKVWVTNQSDSIKDFILPDATFFIELKLAGSLEPIVHAVPHSGPSSPRINRLVDTMFIERRISSELPFFAGVQVRVVWVSKVIGRGDFDPDLRAIGKDQVGFHLLWVPESIKMQSFTNEADDFLPGILFVIELFLVRHTSSFLDKPQREK